MSENSLRCVYRATLKIDILLELFHYVFDSMPSCISCYLHIVNSKHFLFKEFNEGDICTQVEPGMSMVCEKDGTNCHLTNIQCYSPHERGKFNIYYCKY